LDPIIGIQSRQLLEELLRRSTLPVFSERETFGPPQVGSFPGRRGLPNEFHEVWTMWELGRLESCFRGLPSTSVNLHGIWTEIGERPVRPSGLIEEDCHSRFLHRTSELQFCQNFFALLLVLEFIDDDSVKILPGLWVEFEKNGWDNVCSR